MSNSKSIGDIIFSARRDGYNVKIMRITAKTRISLNSKQKPHHVAILVFEHAQLLDVAGPADAFTMASSCGASISYKVTCVTKSGGAMSMSNGLVMNTKPIRQIRPSQVDTLIVAGADRKGLLAGMNDEALKTWTLRVQATTTSRVASVCVGAFALAHWGLLDQRQATSHWASMDQLRRNYPAVSINRDAIFVQDGNIWTAGGVTTGIDLALAMIEADTSRQLAGQVARMLVIPYRRLGNQAQHSIELHAQFGRYGALIDWMKLNLNTPLSVAELARKVNETERSFCRRFVSDAGQTPGRYVEDLRLSAAKRALQGGASVKSAARMAGFTSQEHLSRSFRRRLNMTAQAYRGLYATD
jgi:transcriptional regulator GlxA family with amidase domain